MKLGTVRTAFVAASLVFGSSAFSFLLADGPQSQPVAAQRDQSQQRTVLKNAEDLADNPECAANPNGEPGTVDCAVVVTNDGTVRIEVIHHPRYDDSADRK